MSAVLTLLYFASCSAFANSINESKLRFVHVVWRHGDRTPGDPTFPTDTKNSESTWPQGWGELTNTGVRQQFALGAFFRKRYVETGFLQKNYNSKEIYVRSSNYNRTIMSALANLAGMYPPPKDDRWMENMNWQPIPVHSVPGDQDPMLWTHRPCPKAEQIYFNEVLKSNTARRIENENADLLTFLRNKTGHPISTLDDVRFIYDPLYCELVHNDTHTWPNWVTRALFDRIEELHRLSKVLFYQDPRLQRFRGSLLYWDIASRSEQKSKNATSPAALKYYAYSAHDTTLSALLENLGAFDGRVPQYATALIFELRESNQQKYFIHASYINETGSETPVPLAIRNCEAIGICSLEKFVTMARRRTPTDWYAECGFPQTEPQKIERPNNAASGNQTIY